MKIAYRDLSHIYSRMSNATFEIGLCVFFSQRSLYPLYPADTSLSYSVIEALKYTQLSEIPHLLILPSSLLASIKVSSLDSCFSEITVMDLATRVSIICLFPMIEGSVVVNPGRLVRGVSGTYATVEFDLASVSRASDRPISLVDVASVQVRRL